MTPDPILISADPQGSEAMTTTLREAAENLVSAFHGNIAIDPNSEFAGMIEALRVALADDERQEAIEVRRILAKDGRMLLVVGPFDGPSRD